MKKIGIVTLYGLYNYGNRLQNYAVQTLLEERGYRAESLICEKSIFHRLAYFGYDCLNILRGRGSLRVFRFLKFERKYMHDRFLYNRNKRIPSRIGTEYDGFTVGSDQVWNPLMRQDERYNFFLQFAPENKRIALSPSISVDAIPDEWKNCFQTGWSGFRDLSVREQNGADIIKSITGREAQVLVDPTIALDTEKWNAMADCVKIDREPYLLTYFLGKISPETQNTIDRISKKYGWTVVKLNDLENKKLHSIGPQAFLAYIRQAKVVFTDSFHGCVFSTLFKRPFVACIRHNDGIKSAGIESRLYSLLNMLHLENRLEESCSEDEIVNIDFFECDRMILQKRDEFNRYLDNQLRLLIN